MLGYGVAGCSRSSSPAASPELVPFYRLPLLEQKANFITLAPQTQLQIAYERYWGEPRIEWFAEAIASETHLIPFLLADLKQGTDGSRIELIAFIFQHMSARYADVAAHAPVMDELRAKRKTVQNELIGAQLDGWIEQMMYHHSTLWLKRKDGGSSAPSR